jgi:hypothetical protein
MGMHRKKLPSKISKATYFCAASHPGRTRESTTLARPIKLKLNMEKHRCRSEQPSVMPSGDANVAEMPENRLEQLEKDHIELMKSHMELTRTVLRVLKLV